MRKFFSFFLFLLILGCRSNQVTVHKPKPLPSWYLKPPKSDKRYVYVTGSGINKNTAVINALSNFIALYSIKISSSLTINKFNSNGGLYNRSSKYDVKAVIGKLKVTNYEILKVYPYRYNKILVLVRVDKEKLFDNLKNKLDEKFASYKMRYQQYEQENPIKQLIDLELLQKDLQKELEYIDILKIMNKKFNEKPYINFIRKVDKKILDLKKSIKIDLKSNNYYIKKDIEKFLLKKGLKVGKSNIKLNVKVNKKESKQIMNLVVFNIYYELMTKNNIIASNSIKIILPKHSNLNNALYEEIKDKSLKDFFNL